MAAGIRSDGMRSEAGVAPDLAPLKEGQQHPGFRDLLRRAGENILICHDQIGGKAGQQAAGVTIPPGGPRGMKRIARDGFADAQRLIGQEGRAGILGQTGLAGDRGADDFERVQRRDRSVRGQGECRPRIQHAAKGVGLRQARGTDHLQRDIGDFRVKPRP